MTLFPFKLFWRDKYILVFFLLSFVLNLFIWIYLPLAIRPTSQAVFLHYTVHFGVDLIDNWAQIFSLPFLGLFVLLANAVLAYFVFSFKHLSRLIMVATALIQVILVVAAIYLGFLNF